MLWQIILLFINSFMHWSFMRCFKLFLKILRWALTRHVLTKTYKYLLLHFPIKTLNWKVKIKKYNTLFKTHEHFFKCCHPCWMVLKIIGIITTELQQVVSLILVQDIWLGLDSFYLDPHIASTSFYQLSIHIAKIKWSTVCVFISEFRLR